MISPREHNRQDAYLIQVQKIFEKNRSPSKITPKCYLVTIPPEIRSSILSLLLTERQHTSMLPQFYAHKGLVWGQQHWRLSDQESADRRESLSMLSVLTQTCRLLYFESVALYYSNHSFVFDSVNSRMQMELNAPAS